MKYTEVMRHSKVYLDDADIYCEAASISLVNDVDAFTSRQHTYTEANVCIVQASIQVSRSHYGRHPLNTILNSSRWPQFTYAAAECYFSMTTQLQHFKLSIWLAPQTTSTPRLCTIWYSMRVARILHWRGGKKLRGCTFFLKKSSRPFFSRRPQNVSSPRSVVHTFGIFQAHKTLLKDNSVSLLNKADPTFQQSPFFSVKNPLSRRFGGGGHGPLLATPVIQHRPSSEHINHAENMTLHCVPQKTATPTRGSTFVKS